MLNPIEEAKYANLKAICRELKVPAPPEIMIGLKVHDKNGILIFDDVQRGHSWTRNFWNALFMMASEADPNNQTPFGAGKLTMKDVPGDSYSTASLISWRLDYHIAGNGYVNNAANSTFGIVIGTDDTAFSVEQYALGAQIVHGTGSGQVSHVAMSDPVASYTGGTTTWKSTLARIFNNNSGASITVKEVGLYSSIYPPGKYGTGITQVLFERSVLDPTVPVANGAQLTVTYEISMDFSAID